VEQALKRYPGIKLVGKIRGNWTEEGGRQAMLSMMSAHPDMKGVFAQNDSIAAGVLSVLAERGRTDIAVVGIDGLPAGLELLAKGGQFIATHTSLPSYQAAWQIVSVFDAMNGWKPSLPERMVYTGSVLATAENAQDLLNKLYGKGEPAFDWKKMSRTLNPDGWDPQIDIVPIEPEKQWELFPENKSRLNQAYAKAKSEGEFERVTRLYAGHYKSGPFKS
jgi:ribose transport system substrate-binding protein